MRQRWLACCARLLRWCEDELQYKVAYGPCKLRFQSVQARARHHRRPIPPFVAPHAQRACSGGDHGYGVGHLHRACLTLVSSTHSDAEPNAARDLESPPPGAGSWGARRAKQTVGCAAKCVVRMMQRFQRLLLRCPALNPCRAPPPWAESPCTALQPSDTMPSPQ